MILASKEVIREDYIYILVYLTDDYCNRQEASPENLVERSVLWTYDIDILINELQKYKGDCNKLITHLFNTFKEDNRLSIQLMNDSLSVENIEEMLFRTEMFIADTVIALKNKLNIS